MGTSKQTNSRFVVRGSLRDLLSIPQRVPTDFSKQPMPEAVKRVQASWDTFQPDANPDFEALQFYCLNHLVSLIQQRFHEDERLPDWAAEIARSYVKTLTAQAHRLYTYLVLITTRENRHQYKWDASFTKKHKKKFGAAATVLKEFHDKWCKKYDELKSIKNLMENPPEATLGEYVAHLTYSFDHGEWAGSYGGPKWATVTRALEDMIFGKLSLEMMVDVGYTLAHNGGPIFNKGMTYSQQTGQFRELLDLQRAGFIPTTVLLRKEGFAKYLVKNPEFEVLAKECERVQAEIGGIDPYVDYYKVAAFGVCGDYQYEKEQQVEKYGKPAVTEYEKPPEPEEKPSEEEEEEDVSPEPEYAAPPAPKVELEELFKPAGYTKAVHLYPEGGVVYAVPSKRKESDKALYNLKLAKVAVAYKQEVDSEGNLWKSVKPVNFGQFFSAIDMAKVNS